MINYRRLTKTDLPQVIAFIRMLVTTNSSINTVRIGPGAFTQVNSR